MKTTLLVFILLSTCMLVALEPHFMYDPAISPDGKQICFVYDRDLWVVPFEGGVATRLTSTQFSESGPVYSGNGKYIAYNADREGINLLYRIPATGGTAERICSEPLSIIDWFSDNQSILAIGRLGTPEEGFYKVNLDGKRPTLIAGVADQFGSLTPDNQKIIFSDRGEAYRERYKGSTNGQIWEYTIKEKKYKELTTSEITERYPVTSYSDPSYLYYCATDGKVFQIYRCKNYDFTHAEQLTNFDTWSARDLTIAKTNNRLVYEYFDKIGVYDPKTGKATPLNIIINEDLLPYTQEFEHVISKAKLVNAAPNGKWLAFSYKYDLFVVPEGGGEVKQVTFNQQGIDKILILSDNKTLLYISSEKGEKKLFRTSINDLSKIEQIPWSADKWVYDIYQMNNHVGIHYSIGENRNQIAIADTLCNMIEEIKQSNQVTNPMCEDSNSENVFYISRDTRNWTSYIDNYNVNTKQITRLTILDSYPDAISLTPDNTTLLLSDWGAISKIDLVAKPEIDTTTDAWKAILNGTVKAKDKEKDKAIKPKSTIIDLNNIDLREVTILSNEGNNFITHVTNDTLIYYLNLKERKWTVHKVKLNGMNDEVVASLDGDVSNFDYNKVKDSYYLVEMNSIKKLDIKSKKKDMVLYDFNYQYDRLKLNETLFQQVWANFGNYFYDKNMHGVNWDDIYKRYIPYLQYGYTTTTVAAIVEEMIGEVNASHTGFYPRNEDMYPNVSYARLGIEMDYSEALPKGIRVTKVYRKSQLNQPFGIKRGDTLLAIDDQEITDRTSITPLLEFKDNKKIKLTFSTQSGIINVEMKGLNWSKTDDYKYDNWVEERAQLVENATNSQVGYLHIKGMNDECYKKFYFELFQKNYDKKAVIIDIRNNGGGNIHDDLVEALTKKQYAITSNRYSGGEKNKFPSNTWEKPIILLINQDSFSDAEIFPILFRHLKLGKIVGMPTSGSVIGTGEIRFMDGSSMRMPSNGWWTMDGTNMEGTGAKPDIQIDMTPEQKIADDDVQLKAAIAEILKEIK